MGVSFSVSSFTLTVVSFSKMRYRRSLPTFSVSHRGAVLVAALNIVDHPRDIFLSYPAQDRDLSGAAPPATLTC